jgi:hypothetical protein
VTITFTKSTRGMTIRASGTSDCRGVLEAMGFSMDKPAEPAAADAPVDYKAVMRLICSKRAQRNPSIGVAAWNTAVSVGQWVDYRSDPYAEPQRFKTRCRAEVLSGHTAVVWLEGKSGCVTLESLTVVPLVQGGAS